MKTLSIHRMLLALVLGLVCAVAAADEPKPRAGQRVVETRAWVVDTIISNPGEAREDFLWRLAAYMQAWTNTHGAEVCGYVATDGARWGVKLTTQRSQVMCIMDPSIVPAGFRAERDNIHSHPTADSRGKIELNEATRAAAEAIGENAGLHRLEIGFGFSADDKRNGRGYLVTDGRLMHYDGRRERDLGRIANTVAAAGTH